MRGTRVLVVAVVVMGVAILLGTAVLISVLVHRAFHPAPALGGTALASSEPSSRLPSELTLDQPPDTRIVSVTRQTDWLLAVTLAGGGMPERILVWDTATGRIVANLHLAR